MRFSILFILLALVVTSCYTWDRSFVELSQCKADKQKSDAPPPKSLPLDPQDFFYMKQVEYFEVYNNENSNDEVPYANEIPVRLYKSVPSSYQLKKGEKVVEEKYMYVHNFSNPDHESGEVLYFRTSTYWGEGEHKGASSGNEKLKPQLLRKHFESKKTIDLSTVKEIQMGFWYRQSEDSIRILLNDGSELYQILANYSADKMVFKQISHPNKDVSGKGTNVDQFIQLSEVMNVQGKSGLVYYRNVEPGNPKKEDRQVKVTLNDTTLNIQSIRLQYNKKEKKGIHEGVSYLLTDQGEYVQLKGNHSYITSWDYQKLFYDSGRVPTRAEVEEQMESDSTQVIDN